MRVTKYVDVETEVEVVVEIGAEDIANALAATGAKGSVRALKTAVSNYYMFLKAVPDETVAEMETKYLQPTITFFETQRARFQAELDKRPQEVATE